METVKIYDCDHQEYTLLQTFGNKILLSTDKPEFVVAENPSVFPNSSVWVWDKAVRFDSFLSAFQYITKELPAGTEKLPKGKASIKVYDNKGGEVKL